MITSCLLGVNDFKHHVPNSIVHQTEQLFHEEPHIVNPLFKDTSDGILHTLRKRPPTTFHEALEVYFILTTAFE